MGIGIGEGIFVFSMLATMFGVCIVGIFGSIVGIGENSGWTTFGYTILLLVIIACTMGIMYVGGDQLANGYHMYG